MPLAPRETNAVAAAPCSELHALVLQEASDLVKLLPLKMAAQVCGVCAG